MNEKYDWNTIRITVKSFRVFMNREKSFSMNKIIDCVQNVLTNKEKTIKLI